MTLTRTLLVSDSLEYIREVAGCRTVPVEVGSRYTDEEWSQRLMTVEDFISKHIVSQVWPRLPSAPKGDGVQWGSRPRGRGRSWLGTGCRAGGAPGPSCGPFSSWHIQWF